MYGCVERDSGLETGIQHSQINKRLLTTVSYFASLGIVILWNCTVTFVRDLGTQGSSNISKGEPPCHLSRRVVQKTEKLFQTKFRLS